MLHGSWLSFLNNSWLTIILCVSIPHLVNSWINLSVSYRDRNSAIQTQTNVVWSCWILIDNNYIKFYCKYKNLTGFLNCSFTCLIIFNISSIFDVRVSALKSLIPKIAPNCEMNGAIFIFNLKSFPNPFSTTWGNERRRKVCPVGAVSKTTTEKFIALTSLKLYI